MSTPDDELKEIKAAHAILLREKADADAKWHDEVRATLHAQSIDIATIKANTNNVMALFSKIEGLERRIKAIEEFKMKAIAQMTGAFAVLAVVWKLIDRLWH